MHLNVNLYNSILIFPPIFPITWWRLYRKPKADLSIVYNSKVQNTHECFL